MFFAIRCLKEAIKLRARVNTNMFLIYFLAMAASERRGYELISNLKLQKLVYCARNISFVTFDRLATA